MGKTFHYGWIILAAFTLYTAITKDTRPLLVAFVVFAFAHYVGAIAYIDASNAKDK